MTWNWCGCTSREENVSGVSYCRSCQWSQLQHFWILWYCYAYKLRTCIVMISMRLKIEFDKSRLRWLLLFLWECYEIWPNGWQLHIFCLSAEQNPQSISTLIKSRASWYEENGAVSANLVAAIVSFDTIEHFYWNLEFLNWVPASWFNALHWHKHVIVSKSAPFREVHIQKWHHMDVHA